MKIRAASESAATQKKQPFVLRSFQLYAWLGSNMFHARFTKRIVNIYIYMYIHV